MISNFNKKVNVAIFQEGVKISKHWKAPPTELSQHRTWQPNGSVSWPLFHITNAPPLRQLVEAQPKGLSAHDMIMAK